MIKKIYFIHGWGDNSVELSWVSWVRNECQKKNIEFVAFKLPNSKEPKIKEWVNFLKENVEELDEEVLFLGHSIGCQTILRYLEELPIDKKIGGCIFVAGWLNLLDAAYEEEDDKEIAKPWLETPINFKIVKKHCNNFLSIFSDDDECVPLTDAKIFEKKLGSEIVIKKNEGHFDETERIDEIMEFVKW